MAGCSPSRSRANLSALAFYKYTNFGIQIFNAIAHARHPSLAIVLPLGISFFTFTQIAYLADVYGGYAHERSFVKYGLFVTYFPHLIAGPILHHREMMPQFGAEESRRISLENVAIGLTILVIGLFKKSVVADSFGLIASPVFQAANSNHLHLMDAWGGALAYSLQIYFDFSGYSDMAIGISTLFGIKLPFNFDAPYKSQQHRRILAALAHLAVALPARLSLHSARRQPARLSSPQHQPVRDDGARRPLARRRLHFHHLGRAARVVPDRQSPLDRR